MAKRKPRIDRMVVAMAQMPANVWQIPGVPERVARYWTVEGWSAIDIASVVTAETGVAVSLSAVMNRLARMGLQRRSVGVVGVAATGAENRAFLSTVSRNPAASETAAVLQNPTQNMTENITGPVRSSEGKRGSRQSAFPLTQHGATTPGSRLGGGKAPAGNVAKSQLGPIGHRVEHPSDVPTDSMIISAATIVSPEINMPPPAPGRSPRCARASAGSPVRRTAVRPTNTGSAASPPRSGPATPTARGALSTSR